MLSVIYIALLDALKGKIKINISSIKITKKQKTVALIIAGVAIVVIAGIMTIPCDLKLYSKNDKPIEINRNIYGDFEGKYDISFDIEFEGDGAYHMMLYEVREDFSKKRIKYLDYMRVKDGKFVSTIKVSENVQRLQLMIKATNCKVKINEFKIGDKDITLSYLFMPDNLIYRIKDTLTKDSNNLHDINLLNI